MEPCSIEGYRARVTASVTKLSADPFASFVRISVESPTGKNSTWRQSHTHAERHNKPTQKKVADSK